MLQGKHMGRSRVFCVKQILKLWMFISLSFRFHENMFSERHAEHVESVALCSSLATPYGIINRTGWTCKEYQLIGPVENLISRWRESQSNNTKLTQPTIMWKMGQRRSFFQKKRQTKKLVHVGRRQNASRTRKLLGTMWQAAKNCVVDVVVHGIRVWYCTVKRFGLIVSNVTEPEKLSICIQIRNNMVSMVIHHT